MSRRLIFIILSGFMLLGCSSGQSGLFDFLSIRDFDDNRVELEHPGGPIQPPEIPPDLLDKAEDSQKLQTPETGTVRYRVKHKFRGEEPDAPVRREIITTFTRASRLEALRGRTPTDPAGLDQRMRSDLDVARDVLHSYGFYQGEASGNLRLLPSNKPESDVQHYEVTIIFNPGVRYHIGQSVINVEIAEGADDSARLELPQSLADVGLREGAPVVAEEVLAAVGRVRALFLNRGYPFATLQSVRYFLDHERRVLETEVHVLAGERVYMGGLELRGALSVEPSYFEALKNWKPGQLWNQDAVNIYRESLRQTGLFASIDVRPSEELNHRGERNVVVEVVGALERTIGGALRYDSDLGFGVLGYWENRNFTGRGDRLRFEVPVWQEKQELAAMYRLPFFLRPDQDLLINNGILHENNNSYKLLTATGAIGFERRLSRYWRGTARVRGEGGEIEEVDKKARGYYMFGLPLALTFNDTSNLLDATKGVRITGAAAPYGGYYEDYFSALRTRIDANFFLPLVGEDTLVLALRGVYGSLFGAVSGEVPPTIRFYSGGGGSVRGYDYRSIGPRNENNDPLGGDSLLECSAELRWRFAGDLGLVLFTDGGMVYADHVPSRDESLLWGAGLGLRYYTLLGPVRFDVAFPLNRREDDSAVQLYISIGQSF